MNRTFAHMSFLRSLTDANIIILRHHHRATYMHISLSLI